MYKKLCADIMSFSEHHAFLEVTPNEQISLGEARLRLEDMLDKYKHINDTYAELMLTKLTEKDLQTVEETYKKHKNSAFAQMGKFQDIVELRENALVNAHPSRLVRDDRNPKVKFPLISLPEFNGNLDNWIEFRDRFDSLVNKNRDLSKVDKFNYLLSAVKLPAGQTSVLKNFTLSEENYDSAWQALRERYDDKNKLKSSQFNTMLTMKKMTNDSATELRRIIDDFTSCFTQLDLLGATYEDLRVHVILFRLEEQTRKDWQKTIGDDDPTWERLRQFLVKQWKSMLTVAESSKRATSKSYDGKPSSSKTFTTASSSLPSCPMCREPHLLFRCSKFRALSVSERINTVNSNRLCRNCLSPMHIAKNCTSHNRCRICNQSHHTMLHYERSQSQSTGSAPGVNVSSPPVSNQTPLNANSATFSPNTQMNLSYSSPSGTMNMHALAKSFPSFMEALLSTVTVLVLDMKGNWHLCRALLDSGSQSNYITTELTKKLGIQLNSINVPVVGINGQTSLIRYSTSAIFKSRYQNFQGHAPFMVSDDITGILPQRQVNISNFKIPKDLFLADPQFNIPGKVDMLFGTGIFHKSQLGNTLELPNTPMLIETRFGWTLGGDFPVQSPASTFISCFTQFPNSGLAELDAKIDKFREIENFGISRKLLTPEEKMCEELFEKTTRQDETGRVFVNLPFNEEINKLGTNLSNSLRQFYFQENRRVKDPQYNELYCNYINEMILSNYLSEVKPDNSGHFLPHHGVKRMISTTTKIRPVCNGSSKSETGKSLNDCLLCGPTVQPEIFDILIRFRERKVAIKCDIEKMYLQVFVEPTQRKWQKILWRNSPAEPLRHYELNSVVFGLTSSPYLATRTLNYIADVNATKFPETSVAIKTSIYVDDVAISCDDTKTAQKIRDELRKIFGNSHFPTRKWSSNTPELLRDMPNCDVETIEDSESIKTVGLLWNPHHDEVTFSFKISDSVPSTKAELLSEIASMHDPLGLVGPVILQAKLFMKPLRILKWTEEIPKDEVKKWLDFRSQFSSLNDVKIHRHTVVSNPVSVQIHGFSDAAEPAYGAAIYIRSCDSFGNVQTSLICSKSRVSPPKQKSIPRLELCAATLLSKLVTRIIEILTYQVDEVYLWTDSMIVLWWISAIAARLSTFVGNRVSVIQELTSNFVWKHLRGPLNPADDLSRGLFPSEIVNRTQWWSGPSFLSSPPSEWPESLLTVQENHPDVTQELRKTLTSFSPSNLLTLIESRFSSYRKLINCFCYIRRFAAKETFRKSGQISIEETELALQCIIKIIQQAFFPQECRYFHHLHENPENHEKFPRKSPLHQLTPYMDEKGVIRVGGRIQACPELTEQQKHPAILPRCNFVKLIVTDRHKKLLHPSQAVLISHIRQEFWPLDIKSVVRKVQHECISCFRIKPRFGEQLMAQLPESRVRMSPPFEQTAVDYAGPFNIRSSLTKKSSIIKAYIAVFKCMCTGAIHLEAVTSLSTSAFISCFDRFTSRRGLSHHIFSDNGTNFVGTINEFHKILKELEKDISEHLKEKGIRWTFTTPGAPHAGGYYEAGVKSMKHHLVLECADKSFDFEQFATLLSKIEAILNSRPLTPLTDDPLDIDVLTPAHFLIGRSLIAKPERNFLPVNTGRLDKYNQLQQLQQRIWNRWYHEYLHNLQTRPNHFRELNEFFVGDLVLVKDQNLPPLKWMRGRIIKLLPDKTGVVRNVLIKTPTGEKLRHIRYLCFLPLEKSSSE